MQSSNVDIDHHQLSVAVHHLHPRSGNRSRVSTGHLEEAEEARLLERPSSFAFKTSFQFPVDQLAGPSYIAQHGSNDDDEAYAGSPGSCGSRGFAREGDEQ